MPRRFDWSAPFARWESWPVIAGNLLPLLGIFWLGWDASTLVILYWMETAIIGFWLMVRLLLARDVSLPERVLRPAPGQLPLDGPALAIVLTIHAGIFMAVHLFLLTSLAPGQWSRHLGSPAAFLHGFVIPSGVWIPLIGLFAVRAVITFGEIRAHRPVSHLIAGFYARIILMQFVVLLGGFITMALGSPIALLVLVVLFKTLAELYWERFAPTLEAVFSRTPRN